MPKCSRRWLPLIVFALTGCSTLLYVPSGAMLYDPKTLKLEYQEVKFPSTAEDRTLGAWYFPAKAGVEPRGIFVFFHGNGENLSSHFLSLAWLPQYGFEFLIFDYQGYGPSEGDPSPKGTVQDGVAAMRWAHAKAREKGIPLLVFGQSLGGAVAMRTVLEVKQEMPIAWLVVDSTFESYQSVAAAVLRQRWFTWILQPFAYLTLSDRWAPEGRVGEIAPIPMLVIHGRRDGVVPYRFGEKVFAEAREPKEFWEIPEGTHIDVFAGHDGIYRKRFLDRLNEKFPIRSRKAAEPARSGTSAGATRKRSP